MDALSEDTPNITHRPTLSQEGNALILVQILFLFVVVFLSTANCIRPKINYVVLYQDKCKAMAVNGNTK